MTTLVRARNPLETLSMSQPPQGGRRRSRRLADYNEKDGDFSFTRVAKKAKTGHTEPDVAPAPVPAPAPKKSKQSKERDHEEITEAKTQPRRKMSFSTPKPEKDEVKVAKRGVRKSARTSTGKGQNGETSINGDSTAIKADSNEMAGVPAVDATDRSMVDVSSQQPTMIALPFSDTPVINRNKELRKKGGSTRRSSLGMRGRRASSLIDNGHSALPHREVATDEFYKHIEAGGPSEPRRMKQLLTWTGERALGEKPSHGNPDNKAELAARAINDGLLKDFANRSDFSDWFSREESTTAATAKVVKLPNPKNIECADKVAELEPKIKRLKEERDQWRALSKRPPSLPPLLESPAEAVNPSQIDASLLDPEQAAILSALGNSSFDVRNTVSERLNAVRSTLEFKVDQFTDGMHKIERYQETASRAADRLLALGALRLEDRAQKEKEAVGTRDVPMQEVLRSLSRILPENGGNR
ncbi:mis12-mtw1 family protein [Phlyctema vagabunda]|uniref:Mis12-mtw1 family protein n=1 Tax=Phlyctema vagabunda TaxID=108571 RepID=A0ABR4PGX8_9HELO